MIKNYILISFRNLRKHFTYSLINIFGLGLGLATCLLLVTWILHELSYDKFNEHAERIYRGSMEYSFGGQVARPAVSPNALLPALLTLPEVETGVRVYNPSVWNPYIVKYENKLFHETKFYVADSTFFKVFTYNLIKGNPDEALTEPYSVILTEKMAPRNISVMKTRLENLFASTTSTITRSPELWRIHHPILLCSLISLDLSIPFVPDRSK